jgi:hypothetical protein
MFGRRQIGLKVSVNSHRQPELGDYPSRVLLVSQFGLVCHEIVPSPARVGRVQLGDDRRKLLPPPALRVVSPPENANHNCGHKQQRNQRTANDLTEHYRILRYQQGLCKQNRLRLLASGDSGLRYGENQTTRDDPDSVPHGILNISAAHAGVMNGPEVIESS